MSYRVEVSPAAERDLDRLADFLIEKSSNAAITARTSISEALRSLADFPNRGFSGPKRGLRQLLVHFGDSGYIVRYRVKRDVVVIVSVFHGRERR